MESAGRIAIQDGRRALQPKRAIDMIFLFAGTALLIIGIANYLLTAGEILAWQSTDIAAVLLLISFVIYLTTALCNSTLRYLIVLDPAEDIRRNIAQLQREAPQLWLSCECYHMETRTRIVQRPVTRSVTVESNSSSTTQEVTEYINETEVYQQRVVTHSASEPFAYARFVDTSSGLVGDVGRYQALRIECTVTYRFGDQAAQEAYDRFKARFIAENKARDAEFDQQEHFQTPGLPAKFLSVVDVDHKPVLMHYFWYVAATATGTALLYALWFRNITAFWEYRFEKSVFVD